MKKLLLLFVLGWIGSSLTAQKQNQHTYITDRKFSDPSELIGFNFCPNFVEIPDQMEQDISPGEYSFGITKSNLYVTGPEIKGVYSLNNINTTDYGFKMLLMNARDPRIQGHLKIILNPDDQVEALIFKRSKDDPEMIFYIAEIPAKKNLEERDFFTDLNEVEITSTDSLWGKTLYPFLKIHNDAGTQERLVPADSTSIRFVETITIIDKSKKKKKKETISNIEIGEEETADEISVVETPELVVDEGATPPITEADVEASKDVKIEKEYFVYVRSILTFEDGSQEDKTWEFPVKKIVEREDATAGPAEERFQIEITPLKGDPIYLFLTGNRRVSSFEMGPKKFLMRGH